jgi:hypothetical protein
MFMTFTTFTTFTTLTTLMAKEESMTNSKQKWSLQQYCQLLRLRAAGCPVEYPRESENGHQLRLTMRPTGLGTNLYPVSDGTAIAFWLDIHATTGLIVYRFHIWSPWLAGPILWLKPSTKHENYYHLPPDVWISRSRVLNHRLDGQGEMWRNQHWEGFLLGIMHHTLPASASQQLEAIVSVEDLRGHRHLLPISLKNHPLDPDLLRKYGEEATFPPPRVEVPSLTAKPTPPEKKTESAIYKIWDEICSDPDRTP